MNPSKKLGLVPILVATALAFAGVNSAAAADRLCETNSSPCSSPVFPAGVITAEAFSPLLTGEIEIECVSSTIAIKVAKNDGTVNPTGEVSGLSWTACEDITHGVGCMVTTQGLPYHVEVVTPGPNLTVKPGPFGTSPGVKVVCGAFISCVFQRSDVTLLFAPGSPARVEAFAVSLEKSAGGVLCPKKVFWDADYFAESPTSSLFVSSS